MAREATMKALEYWARTHEGFRFDVDPSEVDVRDTLAEHARQGDRHYLEVEVIFDGALDETFYVLTNDIEQLMLCMAEDVRTEYEADPTAELGWIVSAWRCGPDGERSYWEPGDAPHFEKRATPRP